MKIGHGVKLPFGYGYAWQNVTSMTYQVYLVPFNIIFKQIRLFYFWLAKPGVDLEKKSYNAGFDDGYKKSEEIYATKLVEVRHEIRELRNIFEGNAKSRKTYLKNGRSYCFKCKEELTWCDCGGIWE